ncbi:MAG: hypothetical protein ACREFQ_05105, partial [Stellaceae bacterium]
THPVDPASPLRSVAQIWSDLRGTLGAALFQFPRAIVPGLWADAAWVWLGAAATPVAAVLTLAALAVSCAARRNLPVILMYGSMAALNLFYAAGGMARLWVPVTALLAMSLPMGLEALSLVGRRSAVWTGTVAGGLLAASLALFIVQHDAHPYRDPSYAALADLFARVRNGPALAGNVLTPDPQAFALVTGNRAPMAKPAIGIDPIYAYAVLPASEQHALGGTVQTDNSLWRLVKLDSPLSLAEFRKRVNCHGPPIAAFAVIAGCPMW